MTDADLKPNYRKIYSIVKELYDKTELFGHGPHDETYFTLRVFEHAKELIKLIKDDVKTQQILVAALLHDIGKAQLDITQTWDNGMITQDEWDKHPLYGINISKRILSDLDHSEDFIENVCYLIENHENRGKTMNGRSMELKILQDADLIADYGLTGFIRPFLFGGRNHRTIQQSIEYVMKKNNRIENEGMLNLDVAKKIARTKIKYQKELAEEMSLKLSSELLE